MSETTFGIDLSTESAHRAMALLQWDDGRAEPLELAIGHPIEWLAKRAAKAGWTAIDAPFGWPDRFIETIVKWSEHRGWPEEEDRTSLRYRLTDMRVAETKYPLSVSSDRIASTAMICAQLLQQIANYRQLGRSLDRVGADRVIECYPAGAMKVWEPATKSYKGDSDTAIGVRRTFLSGLTRPRGWLVLEDSQNDQLAENEDLFDALVCSLMARAVSLGGDVVAIPFSKEDRGQAEREGWIHLPAPGSLARLGRPGSASRGAPGSA